MNQIIPNEMQQAFLECENLAKGIRNFDLASQSNQVFPLVNALAFRLTQVIGCTEYIAIN